MDIPTMFHRFLLFGNSSWLIQLEIIRLYMWVSWKFTNRTAAYDPGKLFIEKTSKHTLCRVLNCDEIYFENRLFFFIVESWIPRDIVYATKIIARTFDTWCAQLISELNQISGDMFVSQQRFVAETSKYMAFNNTGNFNWKKMGKTSKMGSIDTLRCYQVRSWFTVKSSWCARIQHNKYTISRFDCVSSKSNGVCKMVYYLPENGIARHHSCNRFYSALQFNSATLFKCVKLLDAAFNSNIVNKQKQIHHGIFMRASSIHAYSKSVRIVYLLCDRIEFMLDLHQRQKSSHICVLPARTHNGRMCCCSLHFGYISNNLYSLFHCSRFYPF